MKMAAFMTDCGRMASLTARGIILVHQWSIKADGKRTSCMGMARRCGKMAGCMRGNIIMARRRGKGRIRTPMAGSILASGCRGRSMGMARYIILMGRLKGGGGSMVRRITPRRPVDWWWSWF